MNMIRTENEKNYGQLEAQAEGNADVEAFVFQNGEIVPAGQTQMLLLRSSGRLLNRILVSWKIRLMG